MTIEEIWNKCLLIIREKVEESAFELWFKTIRLTGIKEGVATIEIPNRFFKEWIEDYHPNLIKDSIEQVTESTVTIRYKAEEKQQSIQTKQSEQLENKRIRLEHKGIHINPKYSFDNFVIGNSNQFAHAAAIAVAESPGKTYNPLFIYGGVGLGKTHLMHAIGNRVLQGRHTTKVLYISSEQFMNEVVHAIRHEKMADVRERFRNLDLLLFDDVQFIAKTKATQEELFHTFNDLYEKAKQIVISADRPPKEISEITDRLRSRFGMGLIADIQPPDVETKIAIIQKKAEIMGIRNLSEDVVNFLAQKIKSNIRELEGSLIRLAAQSSLTGEKINVETARKLLRDIIADDARPVTIESIQKIVCEFYNISLSDIKARKRTREIAIPRQIAMYLCKQLTSSSLQDIGNNFGGKDHATVLYACRQIEERRGKDETLNRMLENLIQKITT
ncbi:MAG: chromosomal replication initiator protein DnaA [Nitrospiraceae bacterium]|nr:chromosomal replication initiator protein DnaA [Nitrospiraceae bacterium]